MSGSRNLLFLPVLGVLLCGCPADPLPEPDDAIAFADTVGYRIEIDRFLDGDAANNSSVSGAEPAVNYQGGDLQGIIDRLESGYFSDLGVSLLILSCPMDGTEVTGLRTDTHSSSAYHGQWPVQVEAMESRFGTQEQLSALVAAAHERGMRVIMEYVMNHVHNDSPVYQNHPDWFWPVKVLGAEIPWDGPDAHMGWVTSYLPDFNYTNVDIARATSVGWAAAWAKNSGVDGFRLGHVKLVDSSWLPALHLALSGELGAKRAADFFLLGDVFSGDRAVLASFLGDTLLDGQTDYPLRYMILETVLIRTAPLSDLGTFLADNQDRYDGVMVNTLGDTCLPRVIHFAEDTPLWTDAWSNGADRAWSDQPSPPTGDSAFQRLAAAFSIVFSLNGIPVILYGDETGLPGAGDPDNQRFMQWGALSSGQTALKAHVARLAKVRAAHTALRTGDFVVLESSTETLVYRRQATGDTVYVAVNRDDVARDVGGLPALDLTDALDDGVHSGPTITVPARSVMILLP